MTTLHVWQLPRQILLVPQPLGEDRDVGGHPFDVAVHLLDCLIKGTLARPQVSVVALFEGGQLKHTSVEQITTY